MSFVKCTDPNETKWRWQKFELSPGITMWKIVLGDSFQEEIRVFILDESNEKTVMDTLKLEFF